MNYLFQVGLGPVQSFIASARRSRDLAFGSSLLSELSKAAALQIVKLNGLESLIFPAPESEEVLYAGTPLNVANKIVALIHHSPDDLGRLVNDAIQQRLHGIRDAAYEKISLTDQRFAYTQIEDLVEFTWVAYPYEEGKYVEVRQQVEALMAARKNTRDFAHVTWGSNRPKSSIDGQLESVIPEEEYPNRKSSEKERFEKIDRLYKNYKAGPAERLSGVDLLKRNGATTWGTNFPSTSHIATLPFLQRLLLISDQKQARGKWHAYIEKVVRVVDRINVKETEITPENSQVVYTARLSSNHYRSHLILGEYEGSMLFEERLVDLIDVVKTPEIRNEARDALRDFYQFIDSQFAEQRLGKERPNPYYALIHADGDGMGAVIDALGVSEQHRRLSRVLGQFASGVETIVKKHQGALVYAGGDDVLAFVPLHTVLWCAQELARGFRETLKGFSDEKGRSPTLSVGIAIVHHLNSLRDALELARNAEKRAKDIDGKNALAITISKRSGEDYQIAGAWGDLDNILEQLIPLCRIDAIPDGTAYELRDLAQRLTVPKNDSHFLKLQEVIKWDALRILQRKLRVPQGKLPEEKADEVESFLKARLGIEQKPSDGKNIKAVDLEAFINELIVAQVLADAMQLASPNKEQSNDSLDH